MNTDNVLSTVSECTASTNNSDIAGASALAEMNERQSAVATDLHSYIVNTWANRLEKRAGIVAFFTVRVSTAISAGTAIQLCTIPAEFRPVNTYESSLLTKQGTAFQLTCTTDGVVQVIPINDIVAQSIFVLHETYVSS